MPIVCVASPKGGAGKTTLAATLGVGLHRIGWRVLALDCDRENALRLHFEMPNDELPGIATALDDRQDWTDLVTETSCGVFVIPFGTAAAGDEARLSAHIGDNPGWVRRQLAPFFEYRDLAIVVDMPPGPSVYDSEIDTLADLHVAVLLADAISLALLPRLQRGDFAGNGAGRKPSPTGYVLNQVEPRRRLCRDVLALAHEALGENLFGTVHQDEAVAEAAACQLTVLDYAPNSVAAHDMAAVANRVHDSLALG
jgi:cellulose synthase operon protein YhjQ